MDKVTDVFFDLDDTLWDFQKNFNLTFEHIFAHTDFGVEMAEFLDVFSTINKKYWELYRKRKTDKFTLHKNRFEETFEELGVEFPAEGAERIAEGYRFHITAFNYLIPGTLETLKYLQNHYNLHILTDGFLDLQEEKLQNSEIRRFFQTVTASDEVGLTKPHPQIFEAALKKARTQKETSVMVGDNLDFDILGAIDSGWEAIYFIPGGHSGYEGKQITAINELKTIL